MLDTSREFCVLSSHLNFTTAARELNESQSTLSRHLAQLERELGFLLIERSPVRLTAAGKAYLKEIERIIFECDELVEKCREVSRLDHMRLTLSMVKANDPVTHMIYDALAQLCAVYPNFSYKFDEARDRTVYQGVETGTVDVGVLFHKPDHLAPGMSLMHVWDEPLSVCVHCDNPLCDHGDGVRFDELAGCAIVLSTNRKFTAWTEAVRDVCARYGCTPSFRVKDIDYMEDFFTTLQNDEIALISPQADSLAKLNSKLHMLRIVEAGGEQHVYPVYLLWNGQRFNPAIERFFETFQETTLKKGGGTFEIA